MADKKLITNDGSATYYSDKYCETYHSKSGALEEADKKYAKACSIEWMEYANILDICFGLGYNSAAAIDNFRGKKIRITGLEIYNGIIEEIIRMDSEYPFKCRAAIQKVAKEKEYSDQKTEIRLIMGDARETIKLLEQNQFDIVFLDPFSPKRCPELWTEEFFNEINSVMKEEGKLATYSCARAVRENLKHAGFEVKDGPVIGRRGPATIAIKRSS